MGNLLWHALHVRPRFEHIVAIRLRQREIEQFVPLRQIGRQRTATHSEAPLFPAYVFCKYDAVPEASFWDIPGVLSLNGTDHINIIPEQQITDIRRIAAARLPVQSWPFTSQGTEVTIEDGPLEGMTGILEGRADKRLLIVSIELIRRSIAVKIDRLFAISSHHPPFPGPAESFRVRGQHQPEQQRGPVTWPHLKRA